MGWNTGYRYRIIGSLFEQDGEIAYIFDVADSEAFLNTNVLQHIDQIATQQIIQPLTATGKSIRAIPEHWTDSFGKLFYIHEHSLKELAAQSEQDWKLRIEGQLFETGNPIKVTPFEVLQDYINKELKTIELEEIL